MDEIESLVVTMAKRVADTGRDRFVSVARQRVSCEAWLHGELSDALRRQLGMCVEMEVERIT